MRKTILALILVIPMLFVIVIFQSAKQSALGINTPASSIEIKLEGPDDGDGDGDTLSLDMAKKQTYTVKADVYPLAATERGYTLSSSDPEVVYVTKTKMSAGDVAEIVPLKEGTAEIVAASNDKGYTDRLSVVVVSSKPYGFGFTLKDEEGNLVALEEAEDTYTATIPSGNYTYGMAIAPIEFTQYEIMQTEETGEIFAEVDKGAKTIFLPFTGKVGFSLLVKDGIDGDIEKTVNLNVTKPTRTDAQGKKETAVALINGKAAFKDPDSDGSAVLDGADASMKLLKGTTEKTLYVESSGGYPTFGSDQAKLKKITGKNGKYTLELSFPEDAEEIEATIKTADGYNIFYLFSFTEEFNFSLFSDREIFDTAEGGREVTILTGENVSFYAVASGGAKGVEYSWKLEGHEDFLTAEGNSATINAAGGGTYVLSVTAVYGGESVTQTVSVKVIKKVSVIKITKEAVDLAENYTVAGKLYASPEPIDNVYTLPVSTFSSGRPMEQAGEEIEYEVTGGGNIAAVEMRNGTPVLIPKGIGTVTVTAKWKGNAAFKANIQGEVALNVVKDAVAVKNSPELIDAAEKGYKIVLTDDIELGKKADGTYFSPEEKTAFLKKHRMKSTYNLAWYESTKDSDITEESSKISYVLEFKNDVYGNGRFIDADQFTQNLDGSSTKPLSKLPLYNGPLYFVKYKQMASVAGQDNCAFLIRTDGVKLYGVNLFGCSNESLKDEETGGYDLTRLNLTGTALEINADCAIVNCRVQNGRNVVRVYGGNRNGNGYFLEKLPNTEIAAEDHIDVKIEGCILTQGREFILKMGANRALRATHTNGQEPQLCNQSGVAYDEQKKSNIYGDGALYKDDWFYAHYVMTDVTLKDSVLETSGLFTVGIESNFSGEFLYEGASEHQWRSFTREWEHSGGTSFASVLHLDGDVRLYDWKDITLIDSSTLIESPIGSLSEWLKLDIRGMIDFVSKKDPAAYGALIESANGKDHVHGGIALYGGGRNYSAVDFTDLEESLSDLTHVNINISELSENTGSTMEKQGEILPSAAGTHDFNFYMYGSTSGNNYLKQLSDGQKNLKYKGVVPVPLFAAESGALPE